MNHASTDQIQQCDLPASEPEEEEAAELSLSTTFELLKNRRRRDTLEFLLRNDGSTTLSDLAEHIAALENDIEIAQLSSDQRKRVYIGLYQCHLPKMDAANVIDFDKNRGTVVLRDEAEQLVPYLRAEDEEDEQSESAAAEPAPRAGFVAESADFAGAAVLGALVGVAGLAGLLPALGGMAWFAALGGVVLVAAVAVARRATDGDAPATPGLRSRSPSEPSE